MSKLFKPLIVLCIFISAFSISIYLFYWSPASSEGHKEPVKAIQPRSKDRRILYEHKSKTQTEIKTITDKSRVNILLLGIEGEARTDTIIFISYDCAGSKLSLISIPRDTYIYEPGYNRGDQRKINAAYGRDREEGSVAAVSKLLCNTPIDYYVSIDYAGVEEIIDAIAGVEIEVPLDMEVGGIEIAKGKQVLHGKEALQYLRFRKKYKDGDLGRIKAQQKLIKTALNKVKYIDLPGIINRTFKSINTNMPMKDMLEYARAYMEDRVGDVTMYMLPGVAMYKSIEGYNWSYFFHNPQKVDALIKKIYEIESSEQKKRKRYELY